MVDRNKRLHGVWSSSRTFVFAATGSCVGLGGIWKFPYVVGENGGGTFVLLYLAFLLLVGLPLLLAEVMLGRRARQSPVNAMRYLTAESGLPTVWSGIGWLGVASGLIILSYYSVVAGWSLQYMTDMASGQLQGADARATTEHFMQLLADPERMMRWQAGFLLLSMAVVVRGVRRGLGLAVRWMMPLLAVLLLILLYYSATVGELGKSIDFVFGLRAAGLTATSALKALGLALFTLSLGVGAMMAYGAYIPDRAPVIKSLLLVILFNVLVALSFAVVVFAMVFAHSGIRPDSGPGLMFITLPLTFGNMPGGLLLGAIFFLLTAIAAWSSAISLLEPGVAWLVESRGCRRWQANLIVGSLAWFLGLGSVFSFNRWRGDINFYGFVDMLTSAILLPLTALLIALFVGWKMRRSLVREEMHGESLHVFNGWYWLFRYLVPVAVGVILVAGLFGLFV